MARGMIVRTLLAGAALLCIVACTDAHDAGRRSPEGVTVGVGGALSVGASSRGGR
jgi:hypothetical protein